MGRLKTILLIILITIIWGTTWLVIKVGLNGISPLYGAGLRFLVAGTALWILARMRGERLPRTRSQIRHILIFGVFMFSLPYGLVYWGEQYIPSSLASILFSAMPFWVILYAHLMIAEERFRFEQGLGSVIGFLGVLLIFSEGEFNFSSMFTLGMLAVLGSSACSGFASVWGKRYSKEIYHFQTTAYGMMVGSLLLLLFSRFEPARFFRPDWMTIGSIVYLGLFGSAVTFSVYFWLMNHVRVVKLSFITFLSPIVAIFVGWLILDETLSLRVFIGTGIVFIGIILADYKKYLRIIRKMPAQP
ncbi:MAG: EamA family transporter [Candidatus Marinimicrobia bacterium]|nr:EamA family transporter [Candidatus Neomarinimicrobiota bacterium]MCF7829880.1 EamA family transporter [Candidatus Neomarinimicrobiota bacterium]MCF7879157.1 EamA family transporter [Candidatus Neomarinimicrobiota bacterium]